MESTEQSQEPWFLKYKFPVFLPSHPALDLASDDYERYLVTEFKQCRQGLAGAGASQASIDQDETDTNMGTEIFTLVSGESSSTTGEVRQGLEKMAVVTDAASPVPEGQHPFMQGLLSHGNDATPSNEDTENKMLTENAGVAYRSTTNALVDLFAELEDVVSGPRLLELLNAAWECDPLVTLKIVFNSRSIHLGKSSRQTFYRCAGWLAKYHPLTLVANLPWLSRPVIQKKIETNAENKQGNDDLVIMEAEKDDKDPARFDVRHGVSHGYWKDLLNILALHVNGKLDVLANPKDILNIEQEKGKNDFPDQRTAKDLRHEKRDARHDAALDAFNNDPVYRALHLTIARLFASELKSDLARLRAEDPKARRDISLCAKWAPSHERFHDKHTFIVSSVAELMHPATEYSSELGFYDAGSKEQRVLYLRYARETYRKDIAALRKRLEVVEREITAKTFENIKYERLPSIAMNNYAPLFAVKDADRFDQYLDHVANGKARISGATLLPSTLIKAVREANGGAYISPSAVGRKNKRKGTNHLVESKIQQMQAKSLDGQWKALVQRIKDSGKLQSSIAVPDVSGSMYSPQFPDGSCPMDTSIGLALLLAEVTEPPFGGAFITFSANPKVQKIDLSKDLSDKYSQLSRADWDMNTDFEAVFEKLILPMALENKLKQEDMVKQIFVFSDMQFDSASYGGGWSTSYERIKRKFEQAGYEMPQLIFWNLAGGRAGYGAGYGGGDPVAPKPITTADEGTAIVSGYSQGMLKVFLDNGSFDDGSDEEADEAMTIVNEDGETVEETRKKPRIDPLSTLKKAIGHKAYVMLKVVD